MQFSCLGTAAIQCPCALTGQATCAVHFGQSNRKDVTAVISQETLTRPAKKPFRIAAQGSITWQQAVTATRPTSTPLQVHTKSQAYTASAATFNTMISKCNTRTWTWTWHFHGVKTVTMSTRNGSSEKQLTQWVLRHEARDIATSNSNALMLSKLWGSLCMPRLK
jgi:hypothetical protein